MAQPRVEGPDRVNDSDRAVAVLDVGGVDMKADEVAFGIGDDVALAALDLLAGVVASGAAAFGGLHRLAVDHAGRRAGFAALALACGNNKGVVDPGQGSVSRPDMARTYLRAQQEQTKREIIRRSALAPKEIAKYWNDWSADPPPDEVRLDALVIGGGGYTDDGAKTFLRVYDSTIAYAGLAVLDKIAEDNDDPNDALSIGEGIVPDHGRQAREAKERKSPQRRELESGMKEATFPLDEGTGVIQWPEPMSEVSYSIFEQFVQLALLRAKASVSEEKQYKEEDMSEEVEA